MKKRCKWIFLVLTLLLVIYSISAQSYTLKVTEEHPFLISNNWIPAKELKVGDELITVDGKTAKITSIKDVSLGNPVEVYNLEAGVYHDFLVDGDVVVHNSNVADMREIIDIVNCISPRIVDGDRTDSNFLEFIRLDKKKMETGIDSLTEEELTTLDTFTKEWINNNGARYMPTYEEGIYEIIPDLRSDIGRIANALKRKKGDLYVSSRVTTSGCVGPSIIFNIYDLAVTRKRFIETTLHEFRHFLDDWNLYENPKPSPEELGASISLEPLVKKIKNYDIYSVSEIYANWAILSKNLKNVKLLSDLRNLLKCETSDLVIFSESIDYHNSALKGIISGLTPEIEIMHSPSFIKNIEISTKNGEKITLYLSNKNPRRDMLKITISYDEGESIINIIDSQSITLFKEILSSGSESLETKNSLIAMLNNQIIPLLDANINSAKHTLVAMIALSKEVGVSVSSPDINIGDAIAFIELANIARGLEGKNRIDLSRYYSNPANTPRARDILDGE